jgi:predicted DNA-binding WGR domain protein
MIAAIERFCSENNYIFVPLNNERDIEQVYDLIIKGPQEDPNKESKLTFIDSNVLLYYGVYYHIDKKFDTMSKYYLLAVEYHNAYAMYNLGNYYKLINNIENMLKYYLLAIKHNNPNAMYSLGKYYGSINDTNTMLKYYLSAVEHKNLSAMRNLGTYYYSINDIPNMLKYYLMGVKHNDSDMMKTLGTYYESIDDVENMLKYYWMVLDNKCEDTIPDLLDYGKKNMDLELFINIYDKVVSYGMKIRTEMLDVICLLINEGKTNGKLLDIIQNLKIENINNVPPLISLLKTLLLSKIDLLELHFQYVPNADGYNQAKNNFYDKLMSK